MVTKKRDKKPHQKFVDRLRKSKGFSSLSPQQWSAKFESWNKKKLTDSEYIQVDRSIRYYRSQIRLKQVPAKGSMTLRSNNCGLPNQTTTTPPMPPATANQATPCTTRMINTHTNCHTAYVQGQQDCEMGVFSEEYFPLERDFKVEIEDLEKQLKVSNDQASKLEAKVNQLQEALDLAKTNIETWKVKYNSSELWFAKVASLVKEREPDKFKWDKHKAKYIQGFSVGREQDTTVKNTTKWIENWVDYIKEEKIIPDRQILKEYIDNGRWAQTTGEKIGHAIVAFHNQFAIEPIKLCLPVGLPQRDATTEMPLDKLNSMIKYLRESAKKMQQEGLDSIKDAKYAKTLALSFLCETGARPNEAGYVLFNKSVVENDAHQWLEPYPYKATMEGRHTKTKDNYTWYIGKDSNWLAESIQRQPYKIPGTYEKFAKSLEWWFIKTYKDLYKLPSPVIGPDGKKKTWQIPYCMRSVRRYRATQYVMHRTECSVMINVEAPPNPLNHATNSKTLLRNYAAHDADNVQKAINRIRARGEGHLLKTPTYLANAQQINDKQLEQDGAQ